MYWQLLRKGTLRVYWSDEPSLSLELSFCGSFLAPLSFFWRLIAGRGETFLKKEFPHTPSKNFFSASCGSYVYVYVFIRWSCFGPLVLNGIA